MSVGMKPDREVMVEFYGFPVLVDFHEGEGIVNIGPGIQGDGGLVFGIPLKVGIASVFLLDMGRIGQHEREEFGGGFGAIDRPSKSLLHEARKISAVIEMDVAEEDRAQLLG